MNTAEDITCHQILKLRPCCPETRNTIETSLYIAEEGLCSVRTIRCTTSCFSHMEKMDGSWIWRRKVDVLSLLWTITIIACRSGKTHKTSSWKVVGCCNNMRSISGRKSKNHDCSGLKWIRNRYVQRNTADYTTQCTLVMMQFMAGGSFFHRRSQGHPDSTRRHSKMQW